MQNSITTESWLYSLSVYSYWHLKLWTPNPLVKGFIWLRPNPLFKFILPFLQLNTHELEQIFTIPIIIHNNTKEIKAVAHHPRKLVGNQHHQNPCSNKDPYTLALTRTKQNQWLAMIAFQQAHDMHEVSQSKYQTYCKLVGLPPVYTTSRTSWFRSMKPMSVQ